jgi:hypothetical protein
MGKREGAPTSTENPALLRSAPAECQQVICCCSTDAAENSAPPRQTAQGRDGSCSIQSDQPLQRPSVEGSWPHRLSLCRRVPSLLSAMLPTVGGIPAIPPGVASARAGAITPRLHAPPAPMCSNSSLSSVSTTTRHRGLGGKTCGSGSLCSQSRRRPRRAGARPRLTCSTVAGKFLSRLNPPALHCANFRSAIYGCKYR